QTCGGFPNPPADAHTMPEGGSGDPPQVWKPAPRHALASVIAAAAALLLLTATAPQTAQAQQKQRVFQDPLPSVEPELHILPVQGNVYMLVGAGSNITLSIGK